MMKLLGIVVVSPTALFLRTNRLSEFKLVEGIKFIPNEMFQKQLL